MNPSCGRPVRPPARMARIVHQATGQATADETAKSETVKSETARGERRGAHDHSCGDLIPIPIPVPNPNPYDGCVEDALAETEAERVLSLTLREHVFQELGGERGETRSWIAALRPPARFTSAATDL